MLKVKEYIKNVGKSAVYAASNILGEQYETVKDFKNTNQEVFKEAYASVKDYKHTFARVSTQIKKSNIYTAANLGINNLLSDLKTGKFYNKEREDEYSIKYGGDLVADSSWDMDESDFDWETKTDVTEGDKIIATAIKKNNKMSTLMMADAMAQGHKAIIDSSRENTTLMYIQQEKMFNKIGGGLDNITSLLKSGVENTAKVQNQQMQNTAKFFTNIEKKTDRIVAQLDEMLQMQRNVYQDKLKQEKERKRNTVTDVMSGGIPNLKEYSNIIKSNIKEQINQATAGIGNMQDALQGANIYAMLVSNPMGEIMKAGMKKGISNEFKKASKEFDKSLKGYFATLISRANKAKNSENGFDRLVGNILGIKVDKKSDSLNTQYNRGAIPFDGTTKKSITEVIPYYLRKMTSILTGEDEQIFDYKTGRWTTVRSVQKKHNDWLNAGTTAGLAELTALITEALNKNPAQVMTSFDSQKRFKENYEKLTNALYRSNGDLTILNKAFEYGIDQDFLEMIKKILRDDDYFGEYYYKKNTNEKNDKTGKTTRYKQPRIKGIDRSKGVNGINTGINTRITLANLARNIFETKAQRAEAFRSMEKDTDLIERILYSEGIVMDPDSKNNPAIRTKNGDYNTKTAFESPLAKAMVFVKDEYNNTLFNYLQGIKKDLTAIRVSGLGLFGLGKSNDKIITDNEMNFEKGEAKRNYDQVRNFREHGGDNYYKNKKDEYRARESYNRRYYAAVEKWEKNGKKGNAPFKVEEFKDITQYLNAQREEYQQLEKEKLSNKKSIYDVLADFGLIDKKEAEKYKKIEYNSDKKMKDNLSSYKGFEKVALISNYANKLVQKPWESATDAIVSLDKWISDLFFGKTLRKNKEDEKDEEKGLLQTMKEKIKDGFHSIIDSISNKVGEWMEKFGEKIKPKMDPVMKWLFGEKADSDSIRSGGIFGGFIGKIEGALKKNSEDVKQYLIEQAKKTKKDIFGDKKDEDITSTSNNGPEHITARTSAILESKDYTNIKNNVRCKSRIESTGATVAGYIKWAHKNNKKGTELFWDATIDDYIKYYNEEKQNQQKKEEERRNRKYNYAKAGTDFDTASNITIRHQLEWHVLTKTENVDEYLAWCKDKKIYGKDIIDIKNVKEWRKEIANINKARKVNSKTPKRQKKSKYETLDEVKSFLAKNRFYVEDINDPLITTYIDWCNKHKYTKFDAICSDTIFDKYIREDNDKHINNEILRRTLSNYRGGNFNHNSIQDTINKNKEKYDKDIEKNTNILERLTTPVEKIAKFLESIAQKLGAIPNIESPTNQHARGGINRTGRAFSSVVSSGEIINGKVVPPGGPYITTIPKNGVVINPADESTMNRQAAQERSFINKLRSNAKADDGLEKSTVVEYMKDENNQKFAADIIAKGGIGLGAGLLLGHPLLAAGIGIASGFSKKSNSFANAIFGSAMTDKDGNVTGRADDGLISLEMQKAIPDIKKFGLGGAIAGLITPFGPVGGLLIGSALGFAKNNGLVQDVLFGPDGVFEKEKKNKFKKALPNIGIGAAAGALIGPFGLIPGAIMGATAGYVTSMDKFKEALFGKTVNTGVKDKDGNEITRKEGGLLGAINKGMDPLKNFGKTMVNGLTDAIFGKKTKKTGKKDEDGNEIMEREGGIFGMVKSQIIVPIAEGIKPIIQESKLMFKKTIGSLTKSIKNYMNDNIGSHFGSRLGKVGEKLGKVGINAAKGALWIGATPLMMGARGIQAIGSGFRRRQIRQGEADDMTAEERLAYRESSNLMYDGGDNYFETDQALVNMSKNKSIDELKQLRRLLLYTANGKNGIDEEDKEYRKNFDTVLTNYVSGSDAHRIMKKLNPKNKAANYAEAERIIRGNRLKDINGEKLSAESKQVLLKELEKLKTNRSGLKNKYDEFENTSIDIRNVLNDLGIDTNEKTFGVFKSKKFNQSVNKLASYLSTEIAHKEANPGENADPISRNTTELEENTSEIKNLTNAIIDNIKVNLGYRKEILNKYGLKESDFDDNGEFGYITNKKDLYKYLNDNHISKGEFQDQVNKFIKEKGYTENELFSKKILAKIDTETGEIKFEKVADEDVDFITSSNGVTPEEMQALRDSRLRGMSNFQRIRKLGFKGNKEFKKNENNIQMDRAEQLLERLQKEASSNWNEAVKDAIANTEPDKETNLYTIVLEGIDYQVSKDNDDYNQQEYKYYVENYIKNRTKGDPSLSSRLFDNKVGRALFKINTSGIIKASAIVSAIGIVASNALLFSPYIMAYAGIKGIKHLKKSGTLGKAKTFLKNKLYRQSNEKDLRKKAKKEWNKLPEKERDGLDEEEWINNKIEELRQGGHTSGIIGAPINKIKNIKNSKIVSWGKSKIAGAKERIGLAVKNVAKKGDDADFKDKLLAKLDNLPRKLKRVMIGEKGKRDGILQKIFGISKLAIGVPLMVGFMKETVFPFFKNKIGPLFLGEKDSNGEYHNGIISEAVNPIKKKFGKVIDWFKNDGEYKDPEKGLSGFGLKLLNGAKSLFDYALNMWSSGANTIVSWAVEKIITRLPELIGEIVVGGIKGIANWILPSNAKADDNLTPLNFDDLSENQSITLNNGIVISKVQDQYGLDSIDNSNDVHYKYRKNFGSKLLTNYGRGLVSPMYRASNKLAGKTLSGAGKIISKIPFTGTVGKGIGKITQFTGNVVEKAVISKDQIMNKIKDVKFYKDYVKENGVAGLKDVINEFADEAKDTVTGKSKKSAKKNKKMTDILKSDTVTNIKDKIKTKAKNISSKVSDHVVNVKGKAKNITDRLGNVVKEGADKIKNKFAKKTVKEGTEAVVEGAAKQKKGIVKKIVDKIEGVLKSLTESDKFKSIFKKSSKTAASEAGEKGLKKAIKKFSKKLSKTLLGKGLSFLKKGLAKIMTKLGLGAATGGLATIAFIIADFVEGVTYARDILQIVEEDIDWGDRLLAGICQVISGFLIFIPESSVCDLILMTIGQFLFENKTKDIREKQKYAEKALAEWNEKNGTNATIEDYNRSFNGNIISDIGTGLKNFGRWIIGKDALKDYSEDYERIPSYEDYKENLKNSRVVTTTFSKASSAANKISGTNSSNNTQQDIDIETANNIVANARANNKLTPIGSYDIEKELRKKYGDEYDNLSNNDKQKIKDSVGRFYIKPKQEKDTADSSKLRKTILTAGGALLGGPLGAIAGSMFSDKITTKEKNKSNMLENISNIDSNIYNIKSALFKALGYNTTNLTPSNSNISASDLVTNAKNAANGNNQNILSLFTNSINDSLESSIKGVDNFEGYIKKFEKQNQSINSLINTGKIDPSSNEFWKINNVKSGNKFIDSILKMNEYFKRLVRAPFAMASETMGNINNVMGNTESESKAINDGNASTDTSNKKTSIWGKIKKSFKSVFGFGRDDDNTNDDYSRASNGHIYQRDYHGSYQTSGDTEKQTIADSGCGPAAAATVMNRYGLKGNLVNAAKYATSNGYKEINGGTYPEYFKDYLSKKGIKATRTKSNKDVIKSLAQGKPVIMMGKDKSDSGKSPYGSKYSHYVVATGLDNKGNVIVEDSEDRRGQTKYNLAETLKNTSIKMTTSAQGKYGRGLPSSFGSTSFTSVLTNYTNSLTKGIYGPYYEALFGNYNGVIGSSSNNNDNNNTGTNSGSNDKNYSGDVTDSGDTESRKKAAWDYFTSNGFSDNLAAGIMGNIQRESGFNPTISEISSGVSFTKVEDLPHNPLGTNVNGTGMGFGLIQWSYAQGHACLYNWCTAHNCDPNTLDGQLKWIVGQMKGIDLEDEANTANESIFGAGMSGAGTMTYNKTFIDDYGGFEGFNKMSIAEAAEAFYRSCERGYNYDNDIRLAIEYGTEIYNQFAGGSSGKGKLDDNNIQYYKSARAKLNKSIPNNKIYTLNNNHYGRGIIKDSVNKAKEKIITANENTEKKAMMSTSLLSNIGNYSTKLMKNIYGDYWTALFGPDKDIVDPSNKKSLNNSTKLNGDVVKGTTVEIPKSVNQSGITQNYTNYTYFFNQWASSSVQRKLADIWDDQGRPSDRNIATIDGYYLLALSLKFGTTGDIVSVELEDGTTFNAIIADSKGDIGWGHQFGNGTYDIVEWEKKGSASSNVDNETQIDLTGWEGKKVSKITNGGSYFDKKSGSGRGKSKQNKFGKGRARTYTPTRKSKYNNIEYKNKIGYPLGKYGRGNNPFKDEDGKVPYFTYLNEPVLYKGRYVWRDVMGAVNGGNGSDQWYYYDTNAEEMKPFYDEQWLTNAWTYKNADGETVTDFKDTLWGSEYVSVEDMNNLISKSNPTPINSSQNTTPKKYTTPEEMIKNGASASDLVKNSKNVTEKNKETIKKNMSNSLLSEIGSYATKLMKNIYGDYWTALFGPDAESEDDESTISVNVNGSYKPGEVRGPIPGYIKIGFRYSEEYNDDYKGSHAGIDMYPVGDLQGNPAKGYESDNTGYPIVCPCNGIVYDAAPTGKYRDTGNIVIVKCTDEDFKDYYFYFMHLDSIANEIVAGTNVVVGTAIGKLGSTGYSTGPHLHFQIDKTLWGEHINPAEFMNIYPDTDMNNSNGDTSKYIYKNDLISGFTESSGNTNNNSEEEEEDGSGRGKNSNSINKTSLLSNRSRYGRANTKNSTNYQSFTKNIGRTTNFNPVHTANKQLNKKFYNNQDQRSINLYNNSDMGISFANERKIGGRGKGINNFTYPSYNNPSYGLANEKRYEYFTSTNTDNNTTNTNSSTTSMSLDQVISILQIIADNSNKTEQIVQLLSLIANNTEYSNGSSNNSSINRLMNQLKNHNNSSSAGMSGLNHALNNNGKDIADAVYSIAKS